jgi:hypothetical protein
MNKDKIFNNSNNKINITSRFRNKTLIDNKQFMNHLKVILRLKVKILINKNKRNLLN